MALNGVHYIQTYTEMIAIPIGPDASSPPPSPGVPPVGFPPVGFPPSQPPGQAAHE